MIDVMQPGVMRNVLGSQSCELSRSLRHTNKWFQNSDIERRPVRFSLVRVYNLLLPECNFMYKLGSRGRCPLKKQYATHRKPGSPPGLTVTHSWFVVLPNHESTSTPQITLHPESSSTGQPRHNTYTDRIFD